MADALSWLGPVMGVIALLLAVIALSRTVPAISWENTGPDLYTLWNQGPGPVVVRQAYIHDSAGKHDVRSYETRTEARISDDERLFGYDTQDGSGWLLFPQLRFTVRVQVNSDLVIDYRAPGPLGWLSRASVRIEGGL